MPKLFRVLVPLVAFFTPMVLHAAPAAASVGSTFHYVRYSNPNRIFAYADPGNYAPGFRTWTSCGNGTVGRGAWQTQPGPWYGSTASCGSEAIVNFGVRFF